MIAETIATWSLLRELRGNLRSVPHRVNEIQDRLLRAAVAHAAAHVPFYKGYWPSKGFDPRGFRGLTDLGRIPIVGATAMKQAARDGSLVDERVDKATCTWLGTSGSSGESVRIFKRPEEERVRRATGLRIWFEHGFLWSDVTAQFQILPGPQLFLQKFGISRKTWISTADSIERQLARFLQTRADIVAGTPTALRGLCAAIKTKGASPKKPRIVFAAGELMDESTHRAVVDALGLEPIALYGQTEVGYLAWQCEHRAGFHINADTHLVEVLRDGVPARPGELGRVVVTDLRGRTMPFLRYDTTDIAIAGDACPCGRPFPVLQSLEGRASGIVTMPDGELLTTRRVVNALTPALALGQFRLEQIDRQTFRLVVLAGTSGDSVQKAQGLLANLLPKARIEHSAVQEWGPNNTGKTHAVVSQVPVSLSASGAD